MQVYIITSSESITITNNRSVSLHYDDVIMGAMASQITSLTIVYSSVYSGADQRKHQSFASLAFVRWIHRALVNYQHKGPVTRKMFAFDDVIMNVLFANVRHEKYISSGHYAGSCQTFRRSCNIFQTQKTLPCLGATLSFIVLTGLALSGGFSNSYCVLFFNEYVDLCQFHDVYKYSILLGYYSIW